VTADLRYQARQKIDHFEGYAARILQKGSREHEWWRDTVFVLATELMDAEALARILALPSDQELQADQHTWIVELSERLLEQVALFLITYGCLRKDQGDERMSLDLRELHSDMSPSELPTWWHQLRARPKALEGLTKTSLVDHTGKLKRRSLLLRTCDYDIEYMLGAQIDDVDIRQCAETQTSDKLGYRRVHLLNATQVSHAQLLHGYMFEPAVALVKASLSESSCAAWCNYMANLIVELITAFSESSPDSDISITTMHSKIQISKGKSTVKSGIMRTHQPQDFSHYLDDAKNHLAGQYA